MGQKIYANVESALQKLEYKNLSSTIFYMRIHGKLDFRKCHFLEARFGKKKSLHVKYLTFIKNLYIMRGDIYKKRKEH
jgi:hypothetical protein